MDAPEVQPCLAVRKGLELVVSVENIEEFTSYPYMFIERRSGDLIGLRANGKTEVVIGIPGVDSLNEENSAFERGVAYTSDRFLR